MAHLQPAATLRLDVAAFFRRPTIQERALAYARKLDAADAADIEGKIEDKLTEAGILIGGLGRDGGFVAALAAHFDAIEETMMEDAPASEYTRSRGSNDPEAYVSSRLENAIEGEKDHAARAFIDEAQQITGVKE